MSVQKQLHKHPDNGDYEAAPVPTVVNGVPLSSTAAMPEDYANRVLSEDERSDQGLQIAYQKHQQQHYQQKQSMGFDLASSDSVSSDGRQKPPMMYQDPMVQIQSSNNNNRTADLNNLPDQSNNRGGDSITWHRE